MPWPRVEPAQRDYEALRLDAIGGRPLGEDAPAIRFARWGLAGLIDRPLYEPVFEAVWVVEARPPWTPYADPRLDLLAQAYGILFEAPGRSPMGPAEER